MEFVYDLSQKCTRFWWSLKIYDYYLPLYHIDFPVPQTQVPTSRVSRALTIDKRNYF